MRGRASCWRACAAAAKLNDGAVLQLVVIDGYIERLGDQELPALVRYRIEAIVASLVNRPRSRCTTSNGASAWPATRRASCCARPWRRSAPGATVLALERTTDRATPC